MSNILNDFFVNAAEKMSNILNDFFVNAAENIRKTPQGYENLLLTIYPTESAIHFPYPSYFYKR